MGQAKVGSLRVVIDWSAIDPTAAAGDNNFSSVDPIVLDAAANGVQVFPFIFGTPDLGGEGPRQPEVQRREVRDLRAEDGGRARRLEDVRRRGRRPLRANGQFWAEHPEVPEIPIEVYQIRNEMNSESFFAPKPNPKQYAKLLSAAADAIRSRDSSAEIVLGGMPELSARTRRSSARSTWPTSTR